MKAYLGIDGGGTKTKFLLVDDTGKILAEDVQPTCHYLQCGLNGVTKVLEDGARECLAKAGLSSSDLGAVFAACAGYGDVGDDNIKIKNAALVAFPGVKVQVGNDCENALAGALAGKSGINIIAGTGSIALGINEKGESYRCGGWHHWLGSDEGSGFWFAREILQEFTKQSDERHPKTALYDAVREYLHLTDDDHKVINIVVEDWALDRTKIASLSRLEGELLAKDDPAALSIVKRAATELSEMPIAIKEHIAFEGTVTCSCTGGIFNLGEAILKPLRDILLNHDITLAAPILEPDAGAALLALKAGNIDITDTIIQNLKR